MRNPRSYRPALNRQNSLRRSKIIINESRISLLRIYRKLHLTLRNNVTRISRCIRDQADLAKRSTLSKQDVTRVSGVCDKTISLLVTYEHEPIIKKRSIVWKV